MATLQKIRDLRAEISQSGVEDDKLRESMMLEARKLLLDLERPQNVVPRIGFQFVESAVCCIACRSGIFRSLVKSSPQNAASVAEDSGVDLILTGRVLRALAAHGAVAQDGPDSYSANTVSKTLARPESEAAMISDVELLAPGWAELPSFLEKNGWKNWTGGNDPPLGKAWDWPAGTGMFDNLGNNPHNGAFNTYMSVFDEGHKGWLDFYPLEDRIVKGIKNEPEAVAFVDVGGGLGHQALKFKQRAPNAPGRVIVQDLGHIWPKEAERPKEVEFEVHDFFKAQPVKGARVYYMRYIMHDWSQETAAAICTELKKVMTPGYSKVIINDWIIPEVEPSMLMTAQDFNLMSCAGGMERTEKLHREYLEKAGLKVTGIFKADDNISEGVIEAEVA